MRGAREIFILRDDNGRGIAISLGADFVSEHEHGVSGIYRDFGVDVSQIGKVPGIESRITKIKSPDLILKEYAIKPKGSAKRAKEIGDIGYIGTFLGLIPEWLQHRDPSEMRELSAYARNKVSIGENGRTIYENGLDYEPISGAWSDGDFGIFARKAEDREFLRELAEAFENNDVAIWLGGGGVFKNAGLCLAIASRLSQETKDGFVEVDSEKNRLIAADEKTGIKDRLKAASDAASSPRQWDRPFTYYALSPRFIDAEQQAKHGTAHPIIYWLNPTQQDRINFGWFTVEQLDEWIAGTGPIPKSKAA